MRITLINAAALGDIETAKALLARGADPSIVGEQEGRTALEWAIECEQTAIVDLLREHSETD